MTWEARSLNPNKGGVSRSGFTSDSRMADAPRSDWSHRLLVSMIVLALIAVGYAVTVGAPV